MITYQLRPGGTRFGLSWYYKILKGCLRAARLSKLSQATRAAADTNSYFNRGGQFHALMHLFLDRQAKIDPDDVVFTPADHPAALDKTQMVDTTYLWRWFQRQVNPGIFGTPVGLEFSLESNNLFGLGLPLTGAADAITEPDLLACRSLDLQFQGLGLTELTERLGRKPRVMWDWKVIGSEDTGFYLDGLQNVAYPMLAEQMGQPVDAFVHLFVYRGQTQTFILDPKRNKGIKTDDHTPRIPNPNHKWWLLALRSEPPSGRRQAILKSFMEAVLRRVQVTRHETGVLDVLPVDEANPAHCRGLGHTCFWLNNHQCDRT